MRGHSANELQYYGQILDSDGTTLLADNVPCGVTDLSGNVREQIHLISPDTTHQIVMYAGDGANVKTSGWVQVDSVLYLVDYKRDPRLPRPGMWAEIFCHAQRTD